MSDYAALAEICGLTLAFLDFFGVSKSMETTIDRIRDEVIPEWFDSESSHTTLGLLFAAAFTATLYLSSDWGYHFAIRGVLLGIGVGLAVVAATLVGVLFWVFLHVLNKPPSGTMGSIGIVVALAGFVLGRAC